MNNIFECVDCLKKVVNIPSVNIYNEDKVGAKVPKFTIAIPTYKRISCLEETLESTLSQKTNYFYNVIVVDNNPERNDETEIFMQKYKSHPLVSYYKNSENVGMAGNFNKCILLSNSNNVVLLHDDDILAPFALSTLAKVLTKIHDFVLIKPETQIFADSYNDFRQNNHTMITKLHPLNFGLKCAVGAPSVILYHKENFMKTGGFNQEYFPCIDYVNSCLCSYVGDSFLLKGTELGGYRIGCNESLKPQTMDMYFTNNQIISTQVLKKYIHSEYLINKLQSAFWDNHYNETIKQYHMNEYSFDRKKIGLHTLPCIIQKVIRFLYRCIIKILNKSIEI